MPRGSARESMPSAWTMSRAPPLQSKVRAPCNPLCCTRPASGGTACRSTAGSMPDAMACRVMRVVGVVSSCRQPFASGLAAACSPARGCVHASLLNASELESLWRQAKGKKAQVFRNATRFAWWHRRRSVYPSMRFPANVLTCV